MKKKKEEEEKNTWTRTFTSMDVTDTLFPHESEHVLLWNATSLALLLTGAIAATSVRSTAHGRWNNANWSNNSGMSLRCGTKCNDSLKTSRIPSKSPSPCICMTLFTSARPTPVADGEGCSVVVQLLGADWGDLKLNSAKRGEGHCSRRSLCVRDRDSLLLSSSSYKQQTIK